MHWQLCYGNLDTAGAVALCLLGHQWSAAVHSAIQLPARRMQLLPMIKLQLWLPSPELHDSWFYAIYIEIKESL